MKELAPYKDLIIKLYELGILSTLKSFADMKFVGRVNLELNYNTGGIGDIYTETKREKIKKLK